MEAGSNRVTYSSGYHENHHNGHEGKSNLLTLWADPTEAFEYKDRALELGSVHWGACAEGSTKEAQGNLCY